MLIFRPRRMVQVVFVVLASSFSLTELAAQTEPLTPNPETQQVESERRLGEAKGKQGTSKQGTSTRGKSKQGKSKQDASKRNTPKQRKTKGNQDKSASGRLKPSVTVGTDGRFPSANDLDSNLVKGTPNKRSGFAWIKFAIIVLALLIWLRMMRLFVDDVSKLQLQADSWGLAIFGVGLAGIITAILLPAYLLGACVLVATCGFPFWRFVHWRNSQVGEQTPRLGWEYLFTSTDIPFHALPDAEFELPFASANGASAIKITMVGKSFSDRVMNAGSQGDGESLSGFQMTLALLGHAIGQRATDVHVGTKDEQVMVRLRIDGELFQLDPLDVERGLAVINVLKVLSDLNIADKRRSQDGSFRADVDGRRLCFRVSSQGTNTGEKLSIRILDPAANFSTFAALGLTGPMQERLEVMLNRNSGLILFGGATGAGKSTTAYAAIRHIDCGERNIVTIEDPIEYSLPSIDQIEVRSRLGQTFEAGLRSVLRQDADVVLVGEIRDEETARVACQAATTGQLVLSTLHATDAISTVTRLADLGVDSHHIAAALRGAVSQRLIRKLCTECRIAFKPDNDVLSKLRLFDFQGELYQSPDPLTNPCVHCHSRGFIGRVGIFEFLEVTPTIRELIYDQADATSIAVVAQENGMTTLWDDGLRLVRDGIISPTQFHRALDES